MDIRKEFPYLYDFPYLEDTDFYHDEEEGFVVCKKTGIAKIKQNEHLIVELTVESATPYTYSINALNQTKHAMAAVVKARVYEFGLPTNFVEDVGSAYHRNCSFNYEVETAKKRAESRAVLDFVGLSQYGWKSEDEVSGNPEPIKRESVNVLEETLKTIEKNSGAKVLRDPKGVVSSQVEEQPS